MTTKAMTCTDCHHPPKGTDLGGFGLGWWRCGKCLGRWLFPGKARKGKGG